MIVQEAWKECSKYRFGSNKILWTLSEKAGLVCFTSSIPSMSEIYSDRRKRTPAFWFQSICWPLSPDCWIRYWRQTPDSAPTWGTLIQEKERFSNKANERIDSLSLTAQLVQFVCFLLVAPATINVVTGTLPVRKEGKKALKYPSPMNESINQSVTENPVDNFHMRVIQCIRVLQKPVVGTAQILKLLIGLISKNQRF